MQEKSDTLSDFLDRFHKLSVRFGGNTVQTCREIDLSRSLFYEIRDGKRPIKDKTWRKLEGAERKAGIGDVPEEDDLADAVRRNDPLPDSEQTRNLMEVFARANDVVAQIRELAPRVGRWPLPEEDKKKQPWVVLLEYRELEATQKTSSKAPGKKTG